VAGRDIKLTVVAKISGIHRNGMNPNIGQLQKLVPKIRIELFVDKYYIYMYAFFIDKLFGKKFYNPGSV
jgi:hypothetical protein